MPHGGVTPTVGHKEWCTPRHVPHSNSVTCTVSIDGHQKPPPYHTSAAEGLPLGGQIMLTKIVPCSLEAYNKAAVHAAEAGCGHAGPAEGFVALGLLPAAPTAAALKRPSSLITCGVPSSDASSPHKDVLHDPATASAGHSLPCRAQSPYCMACA